MLSVLPPDKAFSCVPILRASASTYLRIERNLRIEAKDGPKFALTLRCLAIQPGSDDIEFGREYRWSANINTA